MLIWFCDSVETYASQITEALFRAVPYGKGNSPFFIDIDMNIDIDIK